MEITEIRIKLMEGSEDRLRAFCSITLDQSFVVRDLKIIDGTSGPFVAMPSRKLTGHCGRCGGKNHLRASYCNLCGTKQQHSPSADAPQKLYADVAHPINSECREMIQNAVITEFEAELQRSAQPGYRSRYDDDFDAGEYEEGDYAASSPPARGQATRDDVPRVSSQRVSSQRVPAPRGASTRKPTQRTQTVSLNSSSPEEPKVSESTNDPIDQFGAGLFDSGLDSPSDEASTTESSGDEILARIDSGRPGKAVPSPHLSGQSSDRERVGVPVDRHAAAPEGTAPENAMTEPTKETPQSSGPDDGFGAGLFDA